MAGELKTAAVPSPVKLKLLNAAGVPSRIEPKLPLPVTKVQFEPKVIDVKPPPLAPDAVTLPKNDAEPVIAVVGASARTWEKAQIMRSAEMKKATFVRFILVWFHSTNRDAGKFRDERQAFF